MERKVGEIFTYKNKTYQIVPREKEDCCIGCAFDLGKYACKKPRNEARNNFGHCYFQFREDKKGIIFKEVNNMEIKDNMLTINIPKGMEIDTENSDLAKGIIKFKTKELDYKTIYNKICNKSLVIDSHMEDENKLKAISRLMNIARYYNKDWKPDWNNSREDKWYIYYDHSSCKYVVSSHARFAEDSIYFKNEDDINAVIENPHFKDILNIIFDV